MMHRCSNEWIAYIEDPATDALPAVPTQSFTGGNAYNWSYTFDTETWENDGGDECCECPCNSHEDEAGNINTLDYTYTIDQSSDDPGSEARIMIWTLMILPPGILQPSIPSPLLSC